MANCYYLGRGWGLAEITTLAEQTYLLNMVKNHPEVSCGSRLIVGPNRKKDINVWVDRSLGPAKAITYPIDWYPGEPNNAGGIERCMAIFKGNTITKMMDMECDNERNLKFPFICTHTEYY